MGVPFLQTVDSLTVLNPTTTTVLGIAALAGNAAQFTFTNDGHLRSMWNLQSDGALMELKSWDAAGTALPNVFEYSNTAGSDIKFGRPLTATVNNIVDDAHSPSVGASEKALYVYMPGDIANQKVDIRLGNGFVGGVLEISVTSGYAGCSAVGKVTRLYSMGASANGSIWQACVGQFTEVIGETPNNFTLSDITWDATNSTYRVQIVNRSAIRNIAFVHIKWFGDIAVNYSAAVLGPVYTTDTTVFPKPALASVANVQTIAYATTINIDLTTIVSPIGRITLTGPATINFTGGVDGQKFTLELLQDSTGGRVATLGTGVGYGSDITSYTGNTTASKTDILGFVYKTTARLVAVAKGY